MPSNPTSKQISKRNGNICSQKGLDTYVYNIFFIQTSQTLEISLMFINK